MSGAGRIKGDGSDEAVLYEVKDRTGATRSYRVSEKELLDLWRQAAREGKEPVLVIEFGEVRASISVTRKVRP